MGGWIGKLAGSGGGIADGNVGAVLSRRQCCDVGKGGLALGIGAVAAAPLQPSHIALAADMTTDSS